MTHIFHTDEVADAIEAACDLVDDSGYGMAISATIDDAQDAADEIRSLDGEKEMDVRTLEVARTVLLLAQSVAEMRTDDHPHFQRHADTIGSAIWGSSPKASSVSVGTQVE